MQQIFCLTVTLLLLPALSWGFSYSDNRGLLPIGEQEAFMANAGVALDGSTGAVYYNPAGLATLKGSKISLTANSYLKTNSKISPFMRVENKDIDFKTAGMQAIPTTLVSVWNKTPWVYAFSVLIPHQIKVQDGSPASSPSYSNLQLSRMNSFSLLMVGMTAAAPFEGGWNLGAGCFYTMYATTQQSMFVGTPTVASGIPHPIISHSYFDAQVDGLLCNVGFQKSVSETLRYGWTLRSPLISMNKSGTASSFAQRTDGTTLDSPATSASVDYQIPTDFSFGIEKKFSPMISTYLDLSYQFAASFKTGNPNATQEEKKGTLRANAGLAYKTGPTQKFLFGIAYNPSAVKVDSENYAEDFVSVTGGMMMTTGNMSYGVGVMYAKSTGKIETASYNSSFSTSTPLGGSVSTDAMGVLLNSGYSF